MNPEFLPPPPSLNEVPAQIDVAFRVLFYCRSVSDPVSLAASGQESSPRGQLGHSRRPLNPLEKGAENAALNLLRNYLSGELQLSPLGDWLAARPAVPGTEFPGSERPQGGAVDPQSPEGGEAV